jgi:integrase
MRTLNKLNVKKLATMNKPGRYADGGGLYLQVAEGGSRQWLFRFMLNGRARHMGLGSLQTFTLHEARERARQVRQMLADRVDPIEKRLAERDEREADAAARITFREAANKFIALHADGWTNAKHRDQWRTTLTQYAFGTLGHRPVSAIDGALITAALAPIWQAKPETANRVKQRIERVVAWVNNGRPLPAPSKTKRVKHYAAMPYADVPAFMAKLRNRDGQSARALEFTILTAVRTDVAIGARWNEIDLKARTWTVPAERMKAGKEHRVPLCERAIELLQAQPRERAYVFVGARAGKPLSDGAMRDMLLAMVGQTATVHGFRSSFRDWAAERTSYPNHVAEMALAHSIGNAVEKAYRRGDLFEKRQQLMKAWGAYCTSEPKARADNVVTIRAGA